MFNLTFWGTRGSLPVTQQEMLRYGGNTTCLELNIGERTIIIDAGSGLYNLGQILKNNSPGISAEFFFSHYHYDHIIGFPFFQPFFVKGNNFKIYGTSKEGKSLKTILNQLMQAPYFPITMDSMRAELEFIEITAQQSIDLGDSIILKTLEINHPNACLGFRFEYQGKSISYLCDMEHESNISQELLDFVWQSDLLIYDAYFTDEEYLGEGAESQRSGWGHSTWQEGVKLAQKAKVKQLALTHHAMYRSDSDLDEIELLAKQSLPGCFVAREGMIVEV